MSGIKLGGRFVATMREKNTGRVKWSDTFDNIVVSTGLMHILDVVFAGGTAVNPWYTGLLSSGASLSSNDKLTTMDSSQSTNYSEATRPIFVDARSGVTVTNSAGKSTFTINKDGSVFGGAFLASSNAKAGTTGILLCGAAFTGGDKSGDSGDKLEVTYTFTAADA
jgi:hypothetical protein